MFHCEAGNHQSEPRELKTEIVTEWRVKEYPAVELPKLFGDPHRRFSRGGVGYEAAVTISACPHHAETALKNAPSRPTAGNEFAIESLVDKPMNTGDIPLGLAFDKVGSRFTVRLPSDAYYPKAKVVRVLDRSTARESFLLIEEVKKKAEEPRFVEVSFKIVVKPALEAVA